MRPFLSETQDSDQLQDLGRASVQIVHDLKNQLNGVKLYATFLRKRLEKADRPPEEMETLEKLISSVERASDDLTTIVEYGKPLHLSKRADVDVQNILQSVCDSLRENPSDQVSNVVTCKLTGEACRGEFDPERLAEAFRFISRGALKMLQQRKDAKPLSVTLRKETDNAPRAVIEWTGVNHSAHDPFRSFAGSHEIKMSLAARIVEAHGGLAESDSENLVVTLPLSA